MKSGVYQIKSPTNRIYIGCSQNLEQRKRHYKNINAVKYQTKLYNSLKKYGWENHVWEILEYCSVEKILLRETYYKTAYTTIYGWDKAMFCRLVDRRSTYPSNTDYVGEKIRQGKLNSDKNKYYGAIYYEYNDEGKFIREWTQDELKQHYGKSQMSWIRQSMYEGRIAYGSKWLIKDMKHYMPKIKQ